MASNNEVRVPDIGDFEQVEVIEIHVKAGDDVNTEDPLITLETDKASMDIPSPAAGKVVELKVKQGDRVSAGDLVLLLQSSGSDTESEKPGSESVALAAGSAPAPEKEPPSPPQAPTQASQPETMGHAGIVVSDPSSRRCASSRANWAWTSAASKAAA
jgi:pyruvate dehydrogenase E2 component (dihydrolipoamide acetyltransferase)